MLGMMVVRHLRRHDLHLRFLAEVEELIELVRANVTEDSTIALALEEPLRACLQSRKMGSGANDINDFANGAAPHQLRSLDGGAVLEAFAVVDGLDALRLRLHPPYLIQLPQCGETWLVAHEILAMAHRRNP